MPAKKAKPFRSLRDLEPDKHNANKGTDRGRSMLGTSLREYGAGRSILVDRNGRIIAGNKTVESATAAGMQNLIEVQTTGDELVVVRRMDLDLENDPKAKALAIADNRIAEIDLEWDPTVLANLADVDLPHFWNEMELRKLLGEFAPPIEDGPAAQLDRAVELQQEWRTEMGQLWNIGPHRLYCADCTQDKSWSTLMRGSRAAMVFTDPPWNVAIGQNTNPKHRQRPGMQNDSLSPMDFQTFLSAFATLMAVHSAGDLYCVLSSREWPTLDRQLRNCGYHWSTTIIWVKDIFVFGNSKYHSRYEPLWYGWHENSKSSFTGARDLDDVWEISRPRRSEEHPTMKPVELVTRAILNSSGKNDIVCDPFLGSGTTMISAQNTERACYGMEIDPKYVAVCLERIKEMGLKPLLAESVGD